MTTPEALYHAPLPVVYNPAFPIESFNFIVTDECRRSKHNLRRQVLEYFDASLIGLTATPSKQTFGFFHQNLVMEYGHERAVADSVNINYFVCRASTRIAEGDSTVDKGFWADKRDEFTRCTRDGERSVPAAASMAMGTAVGWARHKVQTQRLATTRKAPARKAVRGPAMPDRSARPLSKQQPSRLALRVSLLLLGRGHQRDHDTRRWSTRRAVGSGGPPCIQ